MKHGRKLKNQLSERDGIVELWLFNEIGCGRTLDKLFENNKAADGIKVFYEYTIAIAMKVYTDLHMWEGDEPLAKMVRRIKSSHECKTNFADSYEMFIRLEECGLDYPNPRWDFDEEAVVVRRAGK